MIFGDKVELILENFIREPTKGFQYRELNRITKLGSSTVRRSLNKLEKIGFIKKQTGRTYDYYEANTDNRLFKYLKIFYTVSKLDKILVDIVERVRPNCIILFGSAARGEDTEKSDIDIFVQAKGKEFDFSKREKELKRKINLLFEPKIESLSKELLNNLANGVTLYGFLEVRR